MIEPAQDPIVNDSLEVYGDPIKDGDIGIDVANQIIRKRNRFGGFTNLAQLDGVGYFGADIFNEFCYSVR